MKEIDKDVISLVKPRVSSLKKKKKKKKGQEDTSNASKAYQEC